MGDDGKVAAVKLTDNILWLLKQAFHFSLNSVNDAIATHGVTTAQIGLLRQLASEPGLSGAELARRLLISPQGVQLGLTALERRGLVERKQDPQHGRIRQAYLTDQGRAVASAVVADAIDAHARVFGVLSVEEQRTLHDLLARVIEHGTGHQLVTEQVDLGGLPPVGPFAGVEPRNGTGDGARRSRR